MFRLGLLSNVYMLGRIWLMPFFKNSQSSQYCDGVQCFLSMFEVAALIWLGGWCHLKKFNFIIMIKSKTCAMSTKFKMADFLLALDHCNNWLFCRSACHTHVYQMSLMHVKLATTAALWGVLAGLLSHPLAKPCTFSPRMTRVQSFVSFCKHLPFEKSYLLELKKERKK